jgi:hypothetical protein
VNMFFKAVLSISFALLVAFPSIDVYANGTARFSVEPSTFDVSYTQGKPLQGNTTFTPSVWHEDKPSGPFNTCVKSNRVNFQVSKLIYPYRVLTDKDWDRASDYDIGTKDEDGFYKGLCIYDPSDMTQWDAKTIQFPNSVLTVSEAANFCSWAENQGRVHQITKTVKATLMHIGRGELFGDIVPSHEIRESVTINLACDCKPLSLSNDQTGPIYMKDNQKIKYGLLLIGSSQAVPPITATLVSGKVPEGMEMKLTSNADSLYLEGVPAIEGDFRFSVKIKDSCPLERSDTREFNVGVRCGALKFATQQQLPGATLKKPYSVSIQTTCNASYENLSFELLGELPAGLSMSQSGLISGTPTEEKTAYFYISVRGTEQGAAKEIHQRFDLNVARELQIIPDKTKGQAGNTEITGVPDTCHSEDNLSISYKDLFPQVGAKMGLFSERETGADPKLGWQVVAGQSGTLKFNAPMQPGRYLFRIYDKNGQRIASSTVFTVVRSITDVAAPSTEPPASLDSQAKTPTVQAPVALGKAGNLSGRSPDLTCGDSLIIPGMNGYKINECKKRYDEAVILVNPDPDASQNLRFEGEKTSVIYTWTAEGTSPSELQVRRSYGKEAKRIGAKVLVDRPGYTGFEFTKSGKTVYFAVEIFNDGRDVNFISIEPEAQN